MSLAQALYDRGRLKEAQHVLVNLHQRAPGFPSLGTAYVLLARLYMEQHGDLMRAGKLLAFVEKHFPDQFQSQESIEARQVFQRLKAAG